MTKKTKILFFILSFSRTLFDYYFSNNYLCTIMNIICHLFNPYPVRDKNSKQILPSLSQEVISNIQNFNIFVLKSYTNFFISLCVQIKEKTKNDINMLPLSKISFKKTNNKSYLNRYFNKWNYKYNLVSPFAALSGISDDNVLNLKNELYFNCLNLLHIDSKILPLFHESNLTKLHDYAFQFFANKDSGFEIINDIIKKDIRITDLLSLLKDFNIVLFAIKNFLIQISPVDDKVKEAFCIISDRFNEKFIFLSNNLNAL